MEINQVYKCKECGNIIELIHVGKGILVCCGQPMDLLIEKINEEGQEKHLPVVKRLKTKIRVHVGMKEHPMVEEHYIELIEVIVDGEVLRKYLKPGDKPFADFDVIGNKIIVKALCNIHGLWKSEN